MAGIDHDGPLPITLDEVKACMSPTGLLELELGIERATNQKLRAELAKRINDAASPPPADDVVKS